MQRPTRTKPCDSCGEPFAIRQVLDGKLRVFYHRRFCLTCSPFGLHNTSKFPPGIASPEELKEHRRKRRNAKIRRYQKKRRKFLRAELIQARGGRCEACEYDMTASALEFHHRDPATKEFGIGMFTGSRARLLTEAAKCDLLCANCHRLRHASHDIGSDPVVLVRRRKKARAVEFMGSHCFGCGRAGPAPLFEFHHRVAREKAFGISQDGIPRRWEKILAELAKCVMLCANCHREVHAGVRQIEQDLHEPAQLGRGRMQPRSY